ncbi:type IV toxin-antitoxin system AbiEi family antitoxin domain-containing protein [Modestobacter sp. SYSU DS0657]
MEPMTGPPALVLRRRALASGLVDDEIRRLRRRGEWTTLQRGAYLAQPGDLDRRQRHLLRVRATVAGLRSPAVVSHASAAVVHGLPLWAIPLDRVHVTRQPPARAVRESRLHSHAARFTVDDAVVVDGLAVTSVPRTVVDLARSLPFEPALAVADAALHRGLTTPAELADVVTAASGTRGSRGARRVVAAADRRSESIGESRSRAVMIEAGLPVPDLQVEVRRSDGGFVGRSDFGWRQQRLLGEFDGRLKYGRLLRPGQSPGDAVFEEKRREDALREERWGVVRWVWAELDTRQVVVDRIDRALARQLR